MTTGPDALRILLDIPETCTALGVRRSKVYQLIKAGELEVVKIGSRSLVTAESITAFVERLREQVAR